MKILSISEFYIRKIKDFVMITKKVQVKILFVDQVAKNLIDLVTISQKLFILEYKCRQGSDKYKIKAEDEELCNTEARYKSMSAEQISDEIIYLTNLCDALLDITSSYLT